MTCSSRLDLFPSHFFSSPSCTQSSDDEFVGTFRVFTCPLKAHVRAHLASAYDIIVFIHLYVIYTWWSARAARGRGRVSRITHMIRNTAQSRGGEVSGRNENPYAENNAWGWRKNNPENTCEKIKYAGRAAVYYIVVVSLTELLHVRDDKTY